MADNRLLVARCWLLVGLVLLATSDQRLVTASLAEPAAQRVERDQNGDGKPDVWITYTDVAAAEGQPAQRQGDVTVDRNADGQVDYWRQEVNGVSRWERGDNDYNGQPDVWAIHAPNGRRQWAAADKNADGRPDAWFYYGAHGEGRQPPAPGVVSPLAGEIDEDFDGTPDKVFGEFPKDRPALP